MKNRFKIAVITTAYYALSHADVMVSRWLEPRPTDVQWGWPLDGAKPQTQIASLYIAPTTHHAPDDRFREIGREIAQRHGVPLFESIREALTLGGETLAVDGVLLIGEHGDYPINERGQKLYPRYELWKEIVQVMREAGRFVPLFNDKHLSYDNARALEMFETSRALGIPFMAGSSLPLCKMEPPLDIPPGSELDQAVTLFYDGAEAYGFHILEQTQSLIEGRRGGESGIRRVLALSGEAVWQAMDDGMWSRELFEAALNASQSATPGDPRENCRLATSQKGFPSPLAFCVEHADGFHAAHLLLNGHLKEFIVAVQHKDGKIGAARVDAGDAPDFYGHFATLDRAIEELFLHNRYAVPLERTLLTTLTINTLMEALTQSGQWMETPHLLRPYAPLPDAAPPRWPQRASAT